MYWIPSWGSGKKLTTNEHPQSIAPESSWFQTVVGFGSNGEEWQQMKVFHLYSPCSGQTTLANRVYTEPDEIDTNALA